MKKLIIEIDTGDEQDDISIMNMFTVQISHMEKVDFRVDKLKTLTVEPCWETKFKGIRCLEDTEKCGFFKSVADERPSQCTWIKQEKAEHLYNLFINGKYDEM